MRLAKHKLGKTKNVKAAKRTAKHKVQDSKAKDNDSTNAVESMDLEETPENQDDAESSSNKCAPKSKAEKKEIRQARRKKNFAANFYKVRAGNVSGKNGPRAINQVSLT